MTTLDYFLKANLYGLLFIGCYYALLRRHTFFGLNRAYLLASVVFSLALPLVPLPAGLMPGPSSALYVLTLPTFRVGADDTSANGLRIEQWFWLVYGLGALAMLVRFGFRLRSVFQIIRRGTAQPKPGYTLVSLPTDNTPSFSFGRYLVLSRTDARNRPDALIQHELAHIRQCHTADILCLEVLRAGFWPVPILLLYKRALQEVHEFLADRAVVHQPAQTLSVADYGRQLVAYALHTSPVALTTAFAFQSTLKQRIIMLQKPASHRRSLLGYALVLPLAGLLTLCTQAERDQPQSAASTAPISGEIYTVVEQQPEFTGGMPKLFEYLGSNLKYPEAAQKVKAQGRVFVQFVVDKEGRVSNAKVLKGIGFGADEEAVRVVSEMPRWKPGRQGGQPVNVQYNLPINFQLD
ncbi:M56 family metallopeptidase [Spirosoma montaniterrae]|uniref:Energy transducer TonB n=1 Tax=Spirosoma montaniterrae TaxID=1178516 RepID=A0A1P9WZG1_9BACT|nr:M56 family metallopeptidase [Spirosoma montaniterrae]AQG80744.1 energy transducer TonB [Spirosoma montaniterrae]